MLHSHLKTC